VSIFFVSCKKIASRETAKYANVGEVPSQRLQPTQSFPYMESGSSILTGKHGTKWRLDTDDILQTRLTKILLVFVVSTPGI
jgi:hypothetical protein